MLGQKISNYFKDLNDSSFNIGGNQGLDFLNSILDKNPNIQTSIAQNKINSIVDNGVQKTFSNSNSKIYVPQMKPTFTKMTSSANQKTIDAANTVLDSKIQYLQPNKLEPNPKTSETATSSSLTEEGAEATSLDLAGNFSPDLPATLAFSAVNSGVNSYQNSQIQNKVQTGSGPDSHNFDSQMNADRQISQNNVKTTIQDSIFAAGSAFGPYGMAAGLAIDAGIGLLTPQADNANVMGTSGSLVNVTATENGNNSND